jgi:hypothetical protein
MDTANQDNRLWTRCGTFFCNAWPARWRRAEAGLLVFGALVFSIIYLCQLNLIATYAVNVPYWDEWENLREGNLSSELSWSWLIARHNEHRIVLTKLLTWVLFRCNGWDLVVQQIVNYMIFGVLLVSLIFWAWTACERRVPLGLWFLLGLFLLAPTNHENHLWGFQSQIHFALLFLVIAVFFLFHTSACWCRIFVGTTAAVLGMYSFSSGAISALIVVLVFAVVKLSVFFRCGRSRQDLLHTFFVVSVVGLAFALWLVGYETPAHHPDLTWPHQRLFWDFLSNSVSLGFGFDNVSGGYGIAILVFLAVPLVVLLGRNRWLPDCRGGAILAFSGAILASLASIALGRAGGFPLHLSKASRYFEISSPLIVVIAVAWCLVLRKRPKPLYTLMAVYFMSVGTAFVNNWDFRIVYEAESRFRQQTVQCIEAYYSGRGDANCHRSYANPINEQLDRAQRLNLSFYRDIERSE